MTGVQRLGPYLAGGRLRKQPRLAKFLSQASPALSSRGTKGPASRASVLGYGEHGPGILPVVTAPALAPAGGAAGDARAAGPDP